MSILDPVIDDEHELFRDADRYIAGGVVSLNRKCEPRRAFRRALGSKMWDVQGREYIDYHAAFSPHLLGHNCAQINEAVQAAMDAHWSLMGSGPTPWEVEAARMLCESVHSLDLVQMTNTGSEATSLAIRLSQAYTGREGVLLTLGGYNGWYNDVARAVMPPSEQIGRRISPGEYPFLPASAGIPESTRRRVHTVNFNDLASIEHVLSRHEIACVMTEPVLQNVGVILPEEGYLEELVALCERHGTVCIFDEVKTGFRSALGGYQSVAGVTPHLSVFGKAIANGFPMGVIGGRADIMNLFDDPDPSRRVLIAGTYNAHPINCAAMIATLKILQNEDVYDSIRARSLRLYAGLETLFEEKGITAVISYNESAFCVYFCEKPPTDWHDVLDEHDFELDRRYRKALLDRGIYHMPIPCKQGSVSHAHSDEDIDRTLEQTRAALQTL